MGKSSGALKYKRARLIAHEVRTSIRVCDPQFELRFVCDMAVRWYALMKGGVALDCMQMGIG